MRTLRAMLALGIGLTIVGWGAPQLHAQKYGGVFRTMLAANPPSLSIHEESTIYTVMPMMPVYSNLVLVDPLIAQESINTIIPELAARWSWSADHRALTFTLREGVQWHDGKPFTSADVKRTFDTVLGRAPQRFKLNPRKVWYANVKEVVTNGDREVTFHLKNPQPGLLVMLASGFTPVYPAHVPAAELRTRTVGTGPYVLKLYARDKSVELEKNPDYFVKNRPYLDGIHMAIIASRATRIANLIAGQADMEVPYLVIEPIKKQLQEKVPQMQFQLNSNNVSGNLIFNTKKPPFNDARLRTAVSLAMDRRALVKGLYDNVAIVGGGALLPAPNGAWGMTDEQMAQVPGMGDGVANKERARTIMRELGYGPDKRLQVKLSSRNLITYTDPAAWVISELKQVFVDATLEVIESGNWHAKVARRDYQMGMNRTANGGDDPDMAFFEHYTCDSQRNYTDYCDRQLEKKFYQQSMMIDQVQRKQFVNEIDLELQKAVARPMLMYTTSYVAYYPVLKNFVLHQVSYSQYRFQEVWLDR
ncbi:MAG: ABC transporter substrate-binding protein [Candidatus Lambdaproteobacteria bacterium]|nr:ABC transporter substrate-binding protein [Candidatus Lambdaproteobacteria bacterium]